MPFFSKDAQSRYPQGYPVLVLTDRCGTGILRFIVIFQERLPGVSSPQNPGNYG
ncbi:hypothetical protein BN1221_04706c [Brenneria goodwinii]|uniref:Uncharacterized protein n=1 Tax=Brenneria goodwinii TaxID=1109412 RepID=A0A0G4K272_9GAMM|nr:hypothetical protein BN1221_04706c [Brenneria goodwinii]